MGQSHTIERETRKKLSDLVASAKEHYAKYLGPKLFYEYVDFAHAGQYYNSVRRDACSRDITQTQSVTLYTF